jgi:hypothetical protein
MQEVYIQLCKLLKAFSILDMQISSNKEMMEKQQLKGHCENLWEGWVK